MKKNKLLALLLVFLLLFCSCGKGEGGEKTIGMDTLFTATENSMTIGQVFFAGKVLGRAAEARLISYYDADMGENTFYSVEITEDLFGCMPDRVVTVCVLGNSESFPERTLLSKDREYYFNTTVWVEGDEIIFLLPTFYTSLPEREEGEIYTTIDDIRHHCGSDAAYREKLNELVASVGYNAEKVLNGAKASFEEAAKRDTAYFKEKKIKIPNEALLSETQQTASALLQKANHAEKTWHGLEELMK